MPALYRNPRLATARPSWLLVALVAMMALATFAWTQTATAAPVTRYVATDGNDDGGANDCTNQAAPCATIAHALTQAVSGDTVEIAAGTYTEGNLLIDKDLTVQGAGEDLATGTVIQANAVAESGADVRVMSISSGAVVVSGVYVRHGDSTGDGGAIQVLAGATVTLADSTLANNRANDGGAIYSAGALTLSNVDVRDNESLQTGGGIESLGTLTILDGSSVNDNVAGHHGGGIRATNPVTITDSTVHGNQGDQGGGLWLTGGAATPFVITDSLIAYNQGTTGAGIYRLPGRLVHHWLHRRLEHRNRGRRRDRQH